MTRPSGPARRSRWSGGLVVGGLVTALAAGCGQSSDSAELPAGEDGVAQLRVEVLERYPHDPEAFTQGLELHDGLLYESTGRYGESDARIVDPDTGEVLVREPLGEAYFGEGLTLVGDQVWQLTWREGMAFVRDAETLAERDRIPYEGEGWGLCYDAPRDRLVMSDGSAELTFRDPETFAAESTVTVTLDDEPVTNVNELECVDDRVYANVWQTDDIIRIDPATGDVTAVVDASDLLDETERQGVDVLNGIAALPDSDRFLITGKLWPWVFEVEFVPTPG